MGETAWRIAQQLQAQLPASVSRAFLFRPGQEAWLRVCLPGARCSIDLTCQRGGDLCAVVVYDHPSTPGAPTARHSALVSCDQLGDLLAPLLRAQGTGRPYAASDGRTTPCVSSSTCRSAPFPK